MQFLVQNQVLSGGVGIGTWVELSKACAHKYTALAPPVQNNEHKTANC